MRVTKDEELFHTTHRNAENHKWKLKPKPKKKRNK